MKAFVLIFFRVCLYVVQFGRNSDLHFTLKVSNDWFSQERGITLFKTLNLLLSKLFPTFVDDTSSVSKNFCLLPVQILPFSAAHSKGGCCVLNVL